MQALSPYDTYSKGKIDLAVLGRTKLGNFENLALKNYEIPGFNQKVIEVTEDYLRLKKSMLDAEAATKSLIDGFEMAEVTDGNQEKKLLLYSKMNDIQKKEAVDNIIAKQIELQSWVLQDPIRSIQMKNCHHGETQNLNCVGFLNLKQLRTNLMWQWSLGNAHIKRILTRAKEVNKK